MDSLKSYMLQPRTPYMATGEALKPTLVPQTAETQAASAAEKARMAKINAQLQAEQARTASNLSDSGMKLADVSSYSPAEAKNVLSGVEKLISLGGADKWKVLGANNGASTTSLETYAGWLRERAGAAAPSTNTAQPLISVTV